MTDPARLLAALDAFQPDAARLRIDGHALARGRLDVLLASRDDEVVAAILARPALWGDALAQSHSYSTGHARIRVARWMQSVLAHTVRVGPLLPCTAPMLDSQLLVKPVALLADCMAHRALRRSAARQLHAWNTPDAWEALRKHDDRDITPETRLYASLHDPARPRERLALFFGADVPRDRRLLVLEYLLRAPESLTRGADVEAVIEPLLDDGVAIAGLVERLARSPDEALRRRVFDRLWPAAQAGASPWPDVGLAVIGATLVRTAPSAALVSIVLDASVRADLTHALIAAIPERPDPSLTPALRRWSSAHKGKAGQALVKPALSACEAASPWSA